jgi:hypothetical protein
VACKANHGKTPFELWYGRRPAVHHLRTFGCISYVKDTTPHLKKLDDRGRKGIFIGYEKGSKAYCVYDPITNWVIVTRDVVFDESASWKWSGSGEGESSRIEHDGGEFTVQYSTGLCLVKEEAMMRRWRRKMTTTRSRVTR